VIPALVIAGVGSGVGKTTVTLGLLEALRRRGVSVQPFKVGPDFIDPSFHELVGGRASYSLDGWMCSRDHVRATVARQAAGADLALIEGVMGCFDGRGRRGAESDEGSTAEVASGSARRWCWSSTPSRWREARARWCWVSSASILI
jgi:cobyrinic acid a,c-diamide synthase